MKKILSTMRRCIDDYNLIEDGDKIAVGVSGGKDSLTLLKALKDYSKFSTQKFDVIGITINLFKEDYSQYESIIKFCKENEIEYHIIPSDIYEIVFNIRKEKNPCSLCSKLRRGMINTSAINLGCNKVALGHTADDMVHTFLLSLFYEGRLNTLQPKTYLDRTNVTVIRPLLYTEEKDIISVAKNLPVSPSRCPADKHTQREYIKQELKHIKQTIPFAQDRIWGALINPDRNSLLDKNEKNK